MGHKWGHGPWRSGRRKNPEHSPSDDNDSLAICTIDNRANTALKKGGLTETESFQSQVERHNCQLKDQPERCSRLLQRTGVAEKKTASKDKIIAITKSGKCRQTAWAAHTRKKKKRLRAEKINRGGSQLFYTRPDKSVRRALRRLKAPR